jgi:nucleoside-diphosphate-sugar epimerase
MRVAIAGAHGKIAIRLIPRLISRGDTVAGLIRNPEHADELRGADVAAVLEAVLHDVPASRQVFCLNQGDDDIERALQRLAVTITG